MKGTRFLEIPAHNIREIRHATERKEVEETGPSFVAIDHIVYARRDSTGDWILRLTTGVEFVLTADSEKFLRGGILN